MNSVNVYKLSLDCALKTPCTTFLLWRHQADGHKDAEQKGGDQKGRHQKDRHPKTGHEKADHQQGGHQKAHHQKEDHHQDSDEQNSKAHICRPRAYRHPVVTFCIVCLSDQPRQSLSDLHCFSPVDRIAYELCSTAHLVFDSICIGCVSTLPNLNKLFLIPSGFCSRSSVSCGRMQAVAQQRERVRWESKRRMIHRRCGCLYLSV